MASIDELREHEPNRTSVHLEETYAVFTDDAGNRYLQIDTYGSAGREMPGKKSQSVQFGPEGIAALRKVLDRLP